MSYITHDWEWLYDLYIYGDDWGMVYHCFTHIYYYNLSRCNDVMGYNRMLTGCWPDIMRLILICPKYYLRNYLTP